MEKPEELPEKEEQLEQTVAPDDDGQCPDGYYFDQETQKCILDVGNGE